MKFSFASLFTKLTLATSVAGTLVGCDEPKLPEPTPITTASTAQARYQVVNAAPGATSAQLLSIDNLAPSTAFAPIPYLGVATYSNLPAGQRLLLFSAAGNRDNQQIAVRPTFNTNSNTTVFLTDSPTRAASGTDPGGVRTVVLADNLTAPAAGRARIRFVNLAPTATGGNTTYGIFNVTNPASPVSLFSAVPFRAYRAINNTSTATPPVTTNFANFTEVPAGSYTLDVRSNATTILAGTQQVVMLDPGKIYTLYVRGIAGNTTTPLGISTVLHN